MAANKDPGVGGPSADAIAGMIGDIFGGIGSAIGGITGAGLSDPGITPPPPPPPAAPMVPTWVFGVGLGLLAIGVGRSVLR
jgi:hypothetical protein